MTGERVVRRLAAILAADVVGYSRLMGRDETGTVARLRQVRVARLQPVLDRRGGRIVKLTDDGALIEFASAVEALSAAIEFQQAMAEGEAEQPESERLVFRVGVHLGDVIVEGDDLYGDGVNVAARLETESAPGRIVISGDMHNATVGRLKATFDDLGLVTLKNIERPVQVYTVRWQPSDWPPPLAIDSPSATAAPAPPNTPLSLPAKPSIAVLPFNNMSGDPEQDYFAGGISEDIITALSNFKSLFVIARNSSFIFKGRVVNIKQVGRQLGVRYVLEGSIRRSAARVRITGQLIEASTGAHLWAEKMDGELSDVFELQDQITARVVSSIAPTIERAEMERLKQRTANTPDSYDAFLRGMALTYQRQPAPARTLFKKAIERDPEYAAAYAMAANTYTQEQAVYGVIPTTEMRADALHHANTALGIATEDAFVLGRCSHPIAYICQQIDRGAVLVDRAVALNPNLAFAWSYRGWISLMQGKPEQALDSFANQMTLSPLDPTRPYALSGIAFGHFFLNRYDEGQRVAKEVMHTFPHHQSFATYIINCVGAGDLAEAKSAAIQFLKFDPGFCVSRASAIYPMQSLDYRRKVDDALRTAGIPE